MSDNLLYCGDNLDVLRRHVKDESVDLVYFDPPFQSNQDTNVPYKMGTGSESSRCLSPFCLVARTRAAAQIKAFEDTWRLCGTPRVFDGRGLSERHALRGLRACHTAEAFHEVVEAGGRVAGAMIAFRTFLGENPAAPGLAYLANMSPRLVELRRALRFYGLILRMVFSTWIIQMTS